MWGPLAYLTAYFIATNNPFRHQVQSLVCIGQMYGLILYYATSMFDLYYKNIVWSRPEALYFWGYYFFVNFIWIMIPGCRFMPPSIEITIRYSLIQFQ